MSDIGSPAVDLGNFDTQTVVDVGGQSAATLVARDTRGIGKEIAPGVVFITNPIAMRMMFETPEGPLGRWLNHELEQAEGLAKHFAPVDTGALRDSIGHEVRRGGVGGLFGDLFVKVEYGAFQELGTSRNPPHPYLRPAILAIFGKYETGGGTGAAGIDLGSADVSSEGD